MPPEVGTSERQGFWFSWSCFLTLCFSVFWFWSFCFTLWNLWVSCVLGSPKVATMVFTFLRQRHWQPTRFSKKRPGPCWCLSAFGVSPFSVSLPVLSLKIFLYLGKDAALSFKSFLNRGKDTFSIRFSLRCPWLLCFLGAIVLFTLFYGLLPCLFSFSRGFATSVSGLTEPHGFTRRRPLAGLFTQCSGSFESPCLSFTWLGGAVHQVYAVASLPAALS